MLFLKNNGELMSKTEAAAEVANAAKHGVSKALKYLGVGAAGATGGAVGGYQAGIHRDEINQKVNDLKEKTSDALAKSSDTGSSEENVNTTSSLLADHPKAAAAIGLATAAGLGALAWRKYKQKQNQQNR